jgi:hypothetical protein
MAQGQRQRSSTGPEGQPWQDNLGALLAHDDETVYATSTVDTIAGTTTAPNAQWPTPPTMSLWSAQPYDRGRPKFKYFDLGKRQYNCERSDGIDFSNEFHRSD